MHYSDFQPMHQMILWVQLTSFQCAGHCRLTLERHTTSCQAILQLEANWKEAWLLEVF